MIKSKRMRWLLGEFIPVLYCLEQKACSLIGEKTAGRRLSHLCKGGSGIPPSGHPCQRDIVPGQMEASNTLCHALRSYPTSPIRENRSRLRSPDSGGAFPSMDRNSFQWTSAMVDRWAKVGDDYYPLPVQWDVGNKKWLKYHVSRHRRRLVDCLLSFRQYAAAHRPDLRWLPFGEL
jgi:hypothetical protein